MKDEPLKPPNPKMLFRHTLVSQVLNRVYRGQARPEAIEAVAGQRHVDFDGKACSVSARTLYRWLAAYEQGGAEALAPTPRRGGPVVLSEALARLLQGREAGRCARLDPGADPAGPGYRAHPAGSKG